MGGALSRHSPRHRHRRAQVGGAAMRTEARESVREPSKSNGKTLYRIADIHQLFTKYFGADYDMQTADATLAVAAANKLDGDPPWLMVISGSGNAKTETVNA